MTIKKKIKKQDGFTGVELAVAVVIVSIFIGLIGTLIFNVYIYTTSAARNSQATTYAVDILEKADKLYYDDTLLNTGVYTTDNSNRQILGINIANGYEASLKIEKYNEQAGNTDKLDLIKILEVNIDYTVGSNSNNVNIKTLKIKENNS